MNGKLKTTGMNGDGPNSLQSSTIHDFNNIQQQYHDSNGSYVNRMMLNGSAYNSPNLANNRRGPPIQERPTFGESALNPDVVPNEKFPSMPDSRSLTLQNGEKDAQNDKSVSNSGN